MNDNSWLISMRDSKSFENALQKIRDYEVIQKIIEHQTLEDIIKKSKTKEFWFVTIASMVGITALIGFAKRIKSTFKRYKKTICVITGIIAAVAIAIVAFCKYNNK